MRSFLLNLHHNTSSTLIISLFHSFHSFFFSVSITPPNGNPKLHLPSQGSFSSVAAFPVVFNSKVLVFYFLNDSIAPITQSSAAQGSPSEPWVSLGFFVAAVLCLLLPLCACAQSAMCFLSPVCAAVQHPLNDSIVWPPPHRSNVPRRLCNGTRTCIIWSVFGKEAMVDGMSQEQTNKEEHIEEEYKKKTPLFLETLLPLLCDGRDGRISPLWLWTLDGVMRREIAQKSLPAWLREEWRNGKASEKKHTSGSIHRLWKETHRWSGCGESKKKRYDKKADTKRFGWVEFSKNRTASKTVVAWALLETKGL